jgi:hypothetical protein
VNEHLVEINGCGDRLRYLRKHPQDARPGEARDVLDRLAVHFEALSMVGADALPSVEAWAEAKIARHPEDAFAFAVAIAALGGDVEAMIGGLADAAKAFARYGLSVARAVTPEQSAGR